MESAPLPKRSGHDPVLQSCCSRIQGDIIQMAMKLRTLSLHEEGRVSWAWLRAATSRE